MAYATCQDLQDRLGFILSPDEQALATQLISEADSHIDFYTGKNFNVNEDEIETFDGNKTITQWTLPNKPVTAVSSITLNGRPFTVDVDYLLSLETSTVKFITVLNDQNLRNVVITYNW